MTADERMKTMQAYRLARLVQENLEDRKSNPQWGRWTKDDDELWAAAAEQEQTLYSDAKAITSRIQGNWTSYSLRDLVEWWFLRDCPWDYGVPEDEWDDMMQTMVNAILAADC